MGFSGFTNFGIYNESEHNELIKGIPSLCHYTTVDAFETAGIQFYGFKKY
jgi:hypothetical protein